MPNSHVPFLALTLAAGAVSGVPVLAKGNADTGAALYEECAGCHQIGADAEHGTGPHLNDIVGRPAGELDDFSYSTAMIAAGMAGLVWDADALDTFIESPSDTIPGTLMTYPGLRDQENRADLIAYLSLFSDSVAERPEGAGYAVAPEVLAIAGDPAYGEYLSSECTACHARGDNADGIPAINARPSADFVTAMHAYKVGARSHPVMNMMAGRLSNEEIAALAAYYETVE